MFIFTKMHGIGNDFILIDNNLDLIENKYEFARKICNRRTGVGADGLILLYDEPGVDINIEIFNSDGSEASMCGNGVRCVCKYLYDTYKYNKREFTIKTKSGIKTVVDMGEATYYVDRMGLFTDERVIYNYPLKLKCGTYNITCVFIGNLHTIIFVDNLYLLPFELIALELQNHKLFHESTNVEFVEIVNKSHIKMRVFERGCGETLGCGTGSCAALYTCIHMRKTENDIIVETKGGKLEVSYNPNNDHIYLTGSASSVFSGNFRQ